MRQLLVRSLAGVLWLASWDRKLHAFRHRDGMGKNWRSYRRGYGRRFASGCFYRCLPKHWSRAVGGLLDPLQLLQFWGTDVAAGACLLGFTQSLEC